MWTYRHGVGRERRDDVPYLRDIRERRLASHVALVRQSDHAVLARSTVRTDLVSLQRVRGAALLRCRHLADRCLRELRDGVDIVAGQDEPEVTRVASGGPSVTSLLAILGRIFLRLASHRISHALWHEQWSLVVRPCEDRPPPLSFADGRQLQPPRGRDWADPFPLHAGDRSWLFFEEVPWHGGHGHISVGELDERGRLHDVRVALATPHHLSYPFVFTHDGTAYLLPESRTSSATTLYRARSLPDDWEAACVLADVPLYDPTLLRRDGVWWLFGTVAAPGESEDDELHLFHAPALEGPWEAHPRNPVVSDVRGARPAGPFIRDGDRLLRPAQDCSGRYGRAVVFKQVLELSPIRLPRGRGGAARTGLARAEPRDPPLRDRYAVDRDRRAPPPATLVSAQRGSFGAGLSLGGLSFLVTLAVGLVSSIVIARIYGVRIVGEFALVSAPTLAAWSLSNLRQGPALVRVLSTEPARSPTVTGLFAAVFAVSWGLTAVVVILLAGASALVFRGPLERPDLLAPALVMLLRFLLFVNPGWNLENVFSAFRAGGSLFWIRLGESVVVLIAAVVAGLIEKDVWALVLATCFGAACTLVQRVVLVRRWMALRTSRAALRDAFERVPEILRFGLKLAPGNLAEGISYDAPIWVLGLSLPAAGRRRRTAARGRPRTGSTRPATGSTRCCCRRSWSGSASATATRSTARCSTPRATRRSPCCWSGRPPAARRRASCTSSAPASRPAATRSRSSSSRPR